MSYQKHCPNCFRRKDAVAVCPHCGFDESTPRSPLCLPYGTILADQYRVGRVLGKPGGFGVTYLGWDIHLQQRVAIKEFLPPDIAARVPHTDDVTVHTAQERKNFQQGKEAFLREARIVAQLDHPNVVRVRSFFNANDTAYMVMDYYEGMTLEDYLTHKMPRLTPELAVPVMLPILDGLRYLHARGMVHRDIKPHNIYLAAIGRPILLDFGAARQTAAESDPKSLSVVLSEGYAPLEQYQRRTQQGPWTDVYGAGATLYRMVTGKKPPLALERLQNDPLERMDEVPAALRPVLARAMALKAEARFQTAEDFMVALERLDADAPATVRPPADQAPPKVEPAPVAVVQAAVPAAAQSPGPAAASPPPAEPPPPGPDPVAAPRLRSARRGLEQLLIIGGAAVIALFVLWLALLRPPETFVPPTPAPASRAAPAEGADDRFPHRRALTPAERRLLPATVRLNGASLDIGGDGERTLSVRIPPLEMARTEVTVSQFALFLEASGYDLSQGGGPCEGNPDTRDWREPGHPQGPNHPVVCVSQLDARAFADWLSLETGQRWRLPTDAEWEYAARAGSRGRYPWGEAMRPGLARCADCGGASPVAPDPVMTGAVNAFGLYDLIDNVREWTCSAASPSGSSLQTECAPRAARYHQRGGFWNGTASDARIVARSAAPPTARSASVGFRVVRE